MDVRGSSSFLIILFYMVCFPGPSVAGYPGDEDIRFIRNMGQWDPGILYLAELNGGYLQITEDGLQYLFYDGIPQVAHPGSYPGERVPASGKTIRKDPGKIDMHATALRFRNRSDRMTVVAQKAHSTYYNYFLGKDPERWASGVPAFSEILFTDIYPGIDMKLYSSNGYLKYDLEVGPGADAGQIGLEYEGLDNIMIRNNTIHAQTSLNEIIENVPYAYQVSTVRDTLKVPCRFRLHENVVSYEFPEGYRQEQTLVIDPLLIFSTYSGSTMDNWGNTATYDDDGNVYSGGTVQDFYGGSLPATSGAFQRDFGGVWDIAVFKFDSTGTNLLYCTYLGGSGSETPFSMIVNHRDELVVFGITGSSDFPVTETAYDTVFQGGEIVTNALGNYNSGNRGINYLSGSDLFVAKLSPDGSSLLGGTYLGGSGNDGINNAPGMPLSRNYGDEFRGEVIVDGADNIYLAGNTASTDFPIAGAFQPVYGGGTQDAILVKLDADLSELLWSTYLGGSLADAAYGIRVTDSGRVYATGGTMSADFPVTPNAMKDTFGGDVDGFVVACSTENDTLIASTLIGTSSYDQSYFLDIDPEGFIYLLGQTGGNYPVSEGVYANPGSGQFIHKLSPELDISILSTVVGSGSGIPDISPTAFLVNECGNIYLSGWGGNVNDPYYLSFDPILKYVGGNTMNMPVTRDAYQPDTDGSDFYLMVLDKDAERLLYGTYLGALNTIAGEHVDGGTSRFDKRGIVYHAICACRDQSQFPTTPGVWSNTNRSNGGCNNGVFKFDLSSLQAAFTTDSYEFDHPGIIQDCFPFEVVFLNKSIGGVSYTWNFGDGNISHKPDSVFYLYSKPGVYKVSLIAYDKNTCRKLDVATRQLRVFEPYFEVPSDKMICKSGQVELKAGGSVLYRWDPANGLSDTDIANPVASPDTTTVYHLYMKDNRDCELEDSVLVTVIPTITADFEYRKVYNCGTHPSLLIANHSLEGNQFDWDFGNGSREEVADSLFRYSYDQAGLYKVRMAASLDGMCTQVQEKSVSISDIFIPNIVTPNNDGRNDTFTIVTDAPMSLKVFNRWGKTVYETKTYQNDWNATGLADGIYYYELILEDDATCKGWIQVMK